MSKNNIDMGPPWQLAELRIFLDNFKKSGLSNVNEIKEQLASRNFNRSVQNIISVYMQNKTYLTNMKNCSAEDLFGIMADQYSQMEQISELNNIRMQNEMQKYIPLIRNYLSNQPNQNASSTQNNNGG